MPVWRDDHIKTFRLWPRLFDTLSRPVVCCSQTRGNMKPASTIPLLGIENTDASLGVVSMPVPGDDDYIITVDGSASQSVPIGFWPRSERVPGGENANDPARKEPVFTGGSAHHMNNYADYLIFYKATKDSLPYTSP